MAVYKNIIMKQIEIVTGKATAFYPIIGFPNYEISDIGTIKSIDRVVKNRFRKGELIKPRLNVYGYLTVPIYLNGKLYTKPIHRLVAESFIPNSHNKRQVNHKNGVKTDNRVENLEWVSQKENIQHAFKNNLYTNRSGAKNSRNGKRVYQKNDNGEIVKEYNFLKDVSKEGFNPNMVSQCCRGFIKSHKDFYWSY